LVNGRSEGEIHKGADADGGIIVGKTTEERAAIGVRFKRGRESALANLHVRALSRCWSVAAHHGKQKDV